MNLIHLVLLAAFVAFVAAMLWLEVRHVHRRDPEDEAAELGTSGLARAMRLQRRFQRRILGLFYLSLSVAILVLSPWVDDVTPELSLRLAWLGMAFVCLLAAVIVALREMGDIGRMAEEETVTVLRNSFLKVQADLERIPKPPKPAPAAPNPAKPRQKRPRRVHRRS